MRGTISPADIEDVLRERLDEAGLRLHVAQEDCDALDFIDFSMPCHAVDATGNMPSAIPKTNDFHDDRGADKGMFRRGNGIAKLPYPYDSREGLDSHSLTIYLSRADSLDRNFLKSLFEDKDDIPNCSEAKQVRDIVRQVSEAVRKMKKHYSKEEMSLLAIDRLEEIYNIVFGNTLPSKNLADEWFSSMMDLSDTQYFYDWLKKSQVFSSPSENGDHLGSSNLAKLGEIIVSGKIDDFGKFMTLLENTGNDLDVWIKEHEKTFGGLSYYIDAMRENFTKEYGAPNPIASTGLDLGDSSGYGTMRTDEDTGDIALLVHQKDIPDGAGMSHEDIQKSLDIYADNVASALRGEVFYYVLENAETGETVDSCGGYVGLDCENNGMLESVSAGISYFVENHSSRQGMTNP